MKCSKISLIITKAISARGLQVIYKRIFLATLFLFLLTLLIQSETTVFAEIVQDPPAKKIKQDKKPVIVDADDVEYLDQEEKIVGKGNVKIDYEDAQLFADNVKINMKTQQGIAWGNVKLYYNDIEMKGDFLEYFFESKKGYMESDKGNESDAQAKEVEVNHQGVKILSKRINFDLNINRAVAPGEVKMYEKDTQITGQNLVYNFDTETGDFHDADFEDTLWYGKAEYANKVNKEKIDFKRAYFTTCERDRPHYRMQARTMYYYIGDKIIAKNALIFIGRVPVMYIPYWRKSLHDTTNLTVTVGHTKRWGWFALTTSEFFVGNNLEAIVHNDHRELQGYAGGVDAYYDLPNYGKGQTKVYHMNQRDKYLKNDEDEREQFIQENGREEWEKWIQETERWRGQVKHQWQIDDSSLALVNFNKMSDFGFMKEYFYQEYESDIQPASEASISHAQEDYNCSIYARKRTNRFYSEIERLPELTYNLNSYQIEDTNLYYHNDLAVVNLNRKIADSSADTSDTDVNRFDTYNELKYPTKLPGYFDWINFVPYAGMRQTYYSKGVNGEGQDLIRGVHNYGGELNTKFYRVSDYTGNLLGVEFNRLRHIITPAINYDYVHEPTLPAHKFAGFDSIDGVGQANVFTFGLQNHLQTKWKQKDNQNKSETQEGNLDKLETVDLVYFYPYVNYYHRVEPGARHFSLINSDLDINPYRWLFVESDSIYDQYQRRFQEANIDLTALVEDKWSLGLGKRYRRDSSEQTTADGYYKFNRLWQARALIRYEAYTDVFQEQKYSVYRDLHCWLLEMSYNIKLKEDGSTRDLAVWVTFTLKAFPDQSEISYERGRDRLKRDTWF